MGSCVVVPPQGCELTLKELHKSHSSISWMKSWREDMCGGQEWAWI